VSTESGTSVARRVVGNNSQLRADLYGHYHEAMKHVASGIVPAVAVDRTAVQPLYRQLYEGFREAIVDGRLRAGQRVPSTRILAAELQISRLPVLNAFDQLLAEGYFESRVGAGTRQGLVLGYGGSSAAELGEGVSRLRDVLERSDARAFLTAP